MAVLFNLSPNLTDDFGGGSWVEQFSGTHNIVDGKFKQNHAIELVGHRVKYYDSNNNHGVVIDNTTQSYSMCFWVKATSWSSSGNAWAEIHDNDRIGIVLYSGGRDFGWRNSSDNAKLATFEQDNTTWHFVALSVPVGKTGTLYLDGVQVATDVSPTNFNQYIRVGNSNPGDQDAKIVIDDWCYVDYAIGNTVPITYLTNIGKFAFLSGDSLYTGISLTQLTNSWNTLTSTQKEALVSSFSGDIPAISDLASISPFRVLIDDIGFNDIKVTGQPKPQTIEPISLINTGAVTVLQSINIVNNLMDVTVKFAITTDLSTYKVYDAIQGAWVTSTDIEQDGMGIAQINALTPQILALLDISNGIAFKQCFIATSENPSAEVSEISAVVDIDGSWSQSVYGTDYGVAYPNKTTMSVRLLTNGDYIINYPVNIS